MASPRTPPKAPDVDDSPPESVPYEPTAHFEYVFDDVEKRWRVKSSRASVPDLE
jgi:hypothetical protein